MRILTALMLCALLATGASGQETRTITDDAGRSVEIPVEPQRIASLDDLRLTIPLIELGAPPVASHGRTSDNGPYLRASKILTGVDFSNSDMIFLGDDLDIEALAKAEPDLIITLTNRDSPIEQLERIAPTVVLDPEVSDYLGIYDRLADITGTEAKHALLQTRYETQLTQLTRLVDAPSLTVSVFSGGEGTVSVIHTFGSLGIVLRDAGFQFPAVYDDIAQGTEIKLSAEFVPELDADIMFDSFRADRNETPADADQRMSEVLPGYCDLLWACQYGQLFRLPREEIYAISYESLSTSVNMLTALLSAQDIQKRP